MRTVQAGADAAMCETGSGVQTAECRQDVEQEAEGDVDAGNASLLGGSVDQVGQASSRDVLREDDQRAVASAFDGPGPGDPFVVDSGQALETLAQ